MVYHSFSMIIALILAALGIIFGQFACLFIVFKVFTAQKAALMEVLRGYFETGDPGTPSEFASFVSILADTFSSKLCASLKSTFMAGESSSKRTEKSIETALALDMAGQASPLVGAVLASFPSLGKLINKNPALLPIAMNFLNKKAAVMPVPRSNGQSQSNFKFGGE